MSGKTQAREAWDAEMVRLYGEIMTNAVAYAVMNMAGQVFEEYENRLAEAEQRAGEMERRYDKITLVLQEKTDEIMRLRGEAR